MSRFDEPLSKALDPKTAKLLHSVLDLETVGDLLRHYPRRYAERGELTSLDALEVDEHVTVVGEVTRLMRKPMRNRGGTWLEVEVVDGTGKKIYLSFFGKGSHVAESRLKTGRRGMFAGKVGLFGARATPRWQLTHPEFELFEEEAEANAAEFAAAPVPIYPAGKDLTPWAIRRAVGVVLDTLGPLEDPLPAELRRRHELPDLADALVAVHRPARLRRRDEGAQEAEVRRGVRAAGRPVAAQGRGGGLARQGPPTRGGRHAGRLRRAAAVLAHRGAGGRR
ncbi:hypothetical protein GCM10020219_051260 [Nonomuraea dietziae]